MKHFVVLVALVCVLCASLNSVKAVSNTELQDTSRFARIISKGDTGVEMVNNIVIKYYPK